MTEKENLALALDGKQTQWIPCFWNGGQIMISNAAGNWPPLGSPAGYDKWGVHWTATEDTYGMFTPTPGAAPVLTDVTKWREQVKFPNLDEVDWEAAAAADIAMMGNDHEHMLQNYYHGNGLFERLHFLMGLQEAMEAIMEEPEAVYDLVGAIADYHIATAEKIAKYYKPDYYTFLDDYGHMKGLFISPKTFDELFAPHFKRIVEAVEGMGMKFISHCCGCQSHLLDNFYRIGVRRFEPCQPCNDLAAMKEKYPDIAVMGGLDIQGVIDYPGVTEEEIRTEVRRCIDEYGVLSGYTVYGITVDMYNPSSFGPGGKMNIICSESASYAHQK